MQWLLLLNNIDKLHWLLGVSNFFIEVRIQILRLEISHGFMHIRSIGYLRSVMNKRKQNSMFIIWVKLSYWWKRKDASDKIISTNSCGAWISLGSTDVLILGLVRWLTKIIIISTTIIWRINLSAIVNVLNKKLTI